MTNQEAIERLKNVITIDCRCNHEEVQALLHAITILNRVEDVLTRCEDLDEDDLRHYLRTGEEF